MRKIPDSERRADESIEYSTISEDEFAALLKKPGKIDFQGFVLDEDGERVYFDFIRNRNVGKRGIDIWIEGINFKQTDKELSDPMSRPDYALEITYPSKFSKDGQSKSFDTHLKANHLEHTNARAIIGKLYSVLAKYLKQNDKISRLELNNLVNKAQEELIRK